MRIWPRGLPGLRGRRGWAVGAAAIALVVFVALFDLNWLIPVVTRHFAADSGRTVQIDDLKLGLSDELEPVVRMRGVRVENATWASTREPMAVAAAASFQFAWSSLWRSPRRMTKLTLIDAQVNLERRADGVRNWRLRNAQDTSPGRLQVLALDADNSRIRFIDAGKALDVTMTSRALPEPVLVAGEPASRQVVFEGRYHDQPFDGEALTGERVTFQETGRWMPLRGHVRSGDTRVDVDGRVADLFKGMLVDAELRARGPTLAALEAFLPVQLPATAPYTFTAHLTKKAREYTFVKLDGEVGRSDLSGELHYDADREVPQLQISLTSRRAQAADLGSLLRGDAPARPKAATTGALSSRRVDTSGLRRIEAEVALRVAELHWPRLPAMHDVQLEARLGAGQLAVKPLRFGWAGGTVNAVLALDARGDVPAAQAQLQWQRVRLEDLLRSQDEARRVDGPLSGAVTLKAAGASAAAMAASADGTVAVRLDGGSLPKKLDAKLGLNVGRMVAALFDGSARVPIQCGVLRADLRDGLLRSQQLVMETARTRLVGEGVLNLREERFDVWLDPQPKGSALLSLSSLIRVTGSLAQLQSTETSLERHPGAQRSQATCDNAKPAS